MSIAWYWPEYSDWEHVETVNLHRDISHEIPARPPVQEAAVESRQADRPAGTPAAATDAEVIKFWDEYHATPGHLCKRGDDCTGDT